MELAPASLLVLCLLVFAVAALYSAVGHGGASGYLAVLTLLAVPAAQAATTALLLNVLVAGIAAGAFFRAGHLRLPLLWPVLAVSVPCAFIGGRLDVPPRAWELLLAAVLVYAALRLLQRSSAAGTAELRSVRWPLLLSAGASVGLASGVIGIGGGILLSPLLVLARWATLKQAAALSAVFIVANSLAGLAGRAARSSMELGAYWPLLLCAALGGWLGARFGSRTASAYLLRILLALVMLAATVKLLLG